MSMRVGSIVSSGVYGAFIKQAIDLPIGKFLIEGSVEPVGDSGWVTNLEPETRAPAGRLGGFFCVKHKFASSSQELSRSNQKTLASRCEGNAVSASV